MVRNYWSVRARSNESKATEEYVAYKSGAAYFPGLEKPTKELDCEYNLRPTTFYLPFTNSYQPPTTESPPRTWSPKGEQSCTSRARKRMWRLRRRDKVRVEMHIGCASIFGIVKRV